MARCSPRAVAVGGLNNPRATARKQRTATMLPQHLTAKRQPTVCRAASDMSLPGPSSSTSQQPSPLSIVSDTGNTIDQKVRFPAGCVSSSRVSSISLCAQTGCQPSKRSCKPRCCCQKTNLFVLWLLQVVSEWMSQYLPWKIISPSTVELLSEVRVVDDNGVAGCL